MYSLLNMDIFHCHVSLLEGNIFLFFGVEAICCRTFTSIFLKFSSISIVHANIAQANRKLREFATYVNKFLNIIFLQA